MAFNTGNSVPSSDLRDLSDNADNLDVAVNSQNSGDYWIDRLGKQRLTWEGMTRLSNLGAAVSAAERAEYAALLAESFQGVVNYATFSLMNSDSSQPIGTPGRVTNDPDPSNNGIYTYTSTGWVYSSSQPISEETLSELIARISDLESASPKFIENDTLMFAAVDSLGMSSWIAANKSDGGVPEYSAEHIRNALDFFLLETPEYLFSLRDKLGNLTSLTINKSDGDFPDFVIDRIASKLARRSGWGSGVASILTDQYIRDETAYQARTDLSKWSIWGSSTAQRFAPFAKSLSSEYGVSENMFYDGGRFSETGEGTAARHGGIPAITSSNAQIPASGYVDIPITLPSRYGPLKSYRCEIAGVTGSAVMTGMTPSDLLRFTRDGTGQSVSVPAGTLVISLDGEDFRAGVQILNIGKNSIADGVTPEYINSLTTRCFDYLSPLYKNTFVIGHFYNSNWTDPNRPGRVIAKGCNDLQRKRYGMQFIDIQAILVSSSVWDLAEVTPTSNDLAQQALGVKPDSLSLDDAHLNDAGYLVMQKTLRNRIDYLKWYED